MNQIKARETFESLPQVHQQRHEGFTPRNVFALRNNPYTPNHALDALRMSARSLSSLATSGLRT